MNLRETKAYIEERLELLNTAFAREEAERILRELDYLIATEVIIEENNDD